jgi:quercetin dioxygenase-like cupin family protein
MMTKSDVTLVDSMQTVRVTLEEEFSDRKPNRENPFKTNRIAFNIYDFEPWQAMPMHRHKNSDSVLLAIQGDGMMFLDDDTFSLEQGEAVYVPAGACYGILAGDNDMVVIASQGPAPVETEPGRGMEYRCPACDLETPVSRNIADNTETICPRCDARLRLKREAERLSVEEVGPPAFIEAEAGAAETTGAGGEEMTGQDKEGTEILEIDMEEAARRATDEQAGHGTEEGNAARIAFSAFQFEPWQVLPMHMNPESDTILYFASGQGIMYLNDEEQSVDAGVAVYVPAGATYGILAGDYDMIAVAVQCPVPIESMAFENLGYNCPVCDLGTPVTTNTFSGCVTVCPRCNIKLKLTKLEDGFEAEETTEPAPASAETV